MIDREAIYSINVSWAPELRKRRCKILRIRKDNIVHIQWVGHKKFLETAFQKYGDLFMLDELVPVSKKK